MRLISALLLISSLIMTMPGTALAQGKGRREQAASAKPEDAAKKKADAEAYQRALKSIPEPKGKIDPWSGAR